MSGICKKSHTCVIIRRFFAHFLFYPCKLCAQKLAQLWQVLDSFSVSWLLVRGTITLLISERLFLLSHSRHKHTHTHSSVISFSSSSSILVTYICRQMLGYFLWKYCYFAYLHIVLSLLVVFSLDLWMRWTWFLNVSSKRDEGLVYSWHKRL